MTDSIHVADGGEVSWIPEEYTERIAELETENERLRRAGYEIGYHDGAKRMADLEQLVRDMHSVMWACRERVCVHRENNCWRVQAGGEGDGECWFEKRMSELGIDTEGGA